VSSYSTVCELCFVPTHTLVFSCGCGLWGDGEDQDRTPPCPQAAKERKGQKGRRKRIEESPTRARKAKAIDRPCSAVLISRLKNKPSMCGQHSACESDCAGAPPYDVRPRCTTRRACPLPIDRWWVPGRARAQSYWATAAAAEWRAESFRRLVGGHVTRRTPASVQSNRYHGLATSLLGDEEVVPPPPHPGRGELSRD
jgi:hypothetical protein